MLVHQSLVNLRFGLLLVSYYLSVVDIGVLFLGCIVFVYVLFLLFVGCVLLLCLCFLLSSVFLIGFLLVTIVISRGKYTNNA